MHIVRLSAKRLLIVVWLGYLSINRRARHVLNPTWLQILLLCIVYILGPLACYLLRSNRSRCILAALEVLILLCHFIGLHRGANGDARLGSCFSSVLIILLILNDSCRVQLLRLKMVITFNQVFILICSHFVEVRMGQAVDGTQPLAWRHSQHPIHKTQCFRTHLTNVFLLECFSLVEVRKFESYKPGILIKLLL